MSKKYSSKSTIAFFGRRFGGQEVDYLPRLSSEDAAWLASFTSVYLGGQEGTKEQKKDANRRRYRAQQSDALSHTTELQEGLPEPEAVNDLDPEKIMIIKETV